MIRGRVLHAAWGFGAPSETFIVDRMLELERLGWEAWVAAKWVLERPEYQFPNPERVLEPRRRDHLARRLGWGGGRESWWLEHPIAKVRPNVIHAHFGWTAAEGLEAAQRHGVPLVAGFHGYDATVYPRHGFGAHDEGTGTPPGDGVTTADGGDIYGELFEQASCILATSRFIAGRLGELGCEREVEVVPSGIRLERFPFRGPRQSASDCRLLFVGRLVPYKGLDVAIRALAGLVAGDDDREPTLTVIGDGPERAVCEALARSLGLEERVDFRGARPRDDVQAALGAADVLVAPSRTTAAGQAEGLGNVVKEALAVGLEVAVSDNGGLPETMPPERRGELVAENDSEALLARLEAIRERRAEWPDRARDGRRWVEGEFDWRRLAPRISAAYARVTEATAG